MKKKVVSFTAMLLIALIVGVSIPIDVAANDIIIPNYTYLSTIGSTLSIEGGYATCSGYINLFKKYDSAIAITLQRSKDSSSWEDVKSWSKSFSSTGLNSLEKSYYVSSGYTYRVQAVATIKSGSAVLETATSYSPEKKY